VLHPRAPTRSPQGHFLPCASFCHLINWGNVQFVLTGHGEDEYVKNTASDKNHSRRQGRYRTYYLKVTTNKLEPDLSAHLII